MWIIALLATATPVPRAATTFITERLRLRDVATVAQDLNGDGRAEVLVYARDPAQCGTGGCTLYVLAAHGARYRVVTRMSVVRLPIRLLPTRSHGWHDLAVRVAGGGIVRAQDVRLRFDGARYPSNPSVAPRMARDVRYGRILIGDEDQAAARSAWASRNATASPAGSGREKR